MAQEPKYILSCGLGRFATMDANAAQRFGANAGETTRKLLAGSIAKAKDAGFEVIGEDVNPNDVNDTMKRFDDRLRERQWAAVNIGYGVRGHKEHTELFEKLLQAIRDEQPKAKVIFSNGPDEVITAIRRNFPGDFA